MTMQAIPYVPSEVLPDLEQYFADIRQASSPLSEEEYHALAACIRLYRTGALDAQQGEDALRRMFHGHLRVVVRLAFKWKTLTSAALDVLDLIQEGNLALLSAIEEYPFEEEGYLTRYLPKRVAWAIVNAIYDKANTIRIPSASQRQAKRKGKDAMLPMQPHSLDQLFTRSEEEGGSLLDILEAPAFILSPPPTCSPEKTHLLALLLAELTTRERDVIHLLFGLGAEGIAYTHAEAASLLRISESTVTDHEYRALHHIRSLYEAYAQETGHAPAFLASDEGFIAYLEQRRGERNELGTHYKTRKVNALLYEAFTRLRQEQSGPIITGERLAQEAGVEWKVANRFLRQRGYSFQTASQERLENAFTALQKQEDALITGELLAQEAGISRAIADQFLRQQGYSIQAVLQGRLENAYAHMSAYKEAISCRKLAEQAHVGTSTARKFLLSMKSEQEQKETVYA